MSKHGVLLPIAPGSKVRDVLDLLVMDWPDLYRWQNRSDWLRDAERVLATWYPHASSRDRNVTARSIAPFYLAQPYNAA